MKANYNISPEMLANDDKFQNDFFKRFQLRTREKPLELEPGLQKDYVFPTFYSEVTCAQAIFLCDYDAAKNLLPHPKMKPVRMPKGRSMVALACYIYRNVLNVGPYNEIAMTIPVLFNPKVDVPVLPVLMNGFKDFGYYVFNMPVTSRENCIRGNEIWGLPKVVQSIDVNQQSDRCVTTATDEAGNDYFRLEIPTAGKSTAFDVTANIYSALNNKLLQSETHFKGDFNIVKNTGVLFRKTEPSDGPYLQLGSGPFADQLRALKIEPTPLQIRYADRMNACFDIAKPGFNVAINSNAQRVA